MLESLLNKVAGLKALKETPTQVFSSEHCEFYKNTYFEKYLQTATPQGMLVVFKYIWNVGANQVCTCSLFMYG